MSENLRVHVRFSSIWVQKMVPCCDLERPLGANAFRLKRPTSDVCAIRELGLVQSAPEKEKVDGQRDTEGFR